MDETKTAIEWYKEGLVFFRNNEYDSAIYCFYNATQLDPNYTSAWNGMGVSYSKTGEYDSALIAIENALLIDPNNERAKNNRDTLNRKINKSQNLLPYSVNLQKNTRNRINYQKQLADRISYYFFNLETTQGKIIFTTEIVIIFYFLIQIILILHLSAEIIKIVITITISIGGAIIGWIWTGE